MVPFNNVIQIPNSQSVTLHVGDCIEVLKTLPSGHFQTCVTSPPYFNLRDYKIEGQIGQEKCPQDYVDRLVTVFREVYRVLRDDATLWLNLGDSYASSGGAAHGGFDGGILASKGREDEAGTRTRCRIGGQFGFKHKDLIGIPWAVAFALRNDGWYLRSDIIWAKSNPMPSSVQDRPTASHEHVFLLAKSEKYYYDIESIKEPSVMRPQNRNTRRSAHPKDESDNPAHRRPEGGTNYESRNCRDVWHINVKPFHNAHFATMVPDLAKKCILAGCPEGGQVIDPFGGAGTTGLVAAEHNRKATLIELNPDYAEITRNRLGDYVET
jgi:site-specific DNA-methyltransferase (adenine-specific)